MLILSQDAPRAPLSGDASLTTVPRVPFVPAHVPPMPPPPTVAQLLARYAREILPAKAPTTRYQQGLLFAWIVEEFGDLPLERLTPTTLLSWRQSLVRVQSPPANQLSHRYRIIRDN